MQLLISFLWTKAKICFPQKAEQPHFTSGSSWSQQPACGSPKYQHVTETPEEEDIGKGITPKEAEGAPD